MKKLPDERLTLVFWYYRELFAGPWLECRENYVISYTGILNGGIVQEDPGPRIGAIVVAAGNSHRMGDVDKITVPLVGKPVITYSLDILEQNPLIGQVVLVAPPLRVNQFKALMDDFNYFKISVVAGGSRRQDSVRNGLVALNDTDWILVHDGARPFIDQAIIELGLEAVLTTGAATAAVSLKDTIKEADDSGVVIRTLKREHFWAVQTPQVFSTRLLTQAHEEISSDVTDDAAMVEMIGGIVKIFPGSDENLKLTTVSDITFAEAILQQRLLQDMSSN